VRRAHIAGHSSGAAVAAQLALDHPACVHTLILLELSLLSVPSGKAFLEQATPAFEAYENGDHSSALALFMGAVSGLDWTTCHAVLEEQAPGAVTQAIKDADTLFGIELPALTRWQFGVEQAATIHQPVLSVRGAETQPLWVEVAEFLRTSLPHVAECTIDKVGHLLHVQRPEPVAQRMAQFLTGNSMAGPDAEGAANQSNPRRKDATHQREAH
jgi:pimeloyl-ACP methyl ester carboxylesterase